MLRLLADENFNGDIVRGLSLLDEDLDLIRVQEVGLSGATDPDILAWAAAHQRIVLTHDRATMSHFAYERIVKDKLMAGLFVIDDRLPVRTAIEELALIAACSETSEWENRAVHLPL